MKCMHDITDVEFAGGRMTLQVDGAAVSVALAEVSPVLAKAKKVERETYTVSASGYGIHWPMVDEDLSVDGLLRKAKPANYPECPAKVLVVHEAGEAYGVAHRKKRDKAVK